MAPEDPAPVPAARPSPSVAAPLRRIDRAGAAG